MIVRFSILAGSLLLIACVTDWKPASRGDIFRFTTVGRSFPFDSIILGERWSSASKYGARDDDTLFALPSGTFGGADAISVHRDVRGVVTQLEFTYRTGRDVRALLNAYRSALGPPTSVTIDTVSRSIHTTRSWQNARTEFAISTVDPPDGGVAASARLIDLRPDLAAHR
jgi:hypothetical protein